MKKEKPLTDAYVRRELKKCSEPGCYICRLSRELLRERERVMTCAQALGEMFLFLRRRGIDVTVVQDHGGIDA